MAVTVTSAFLGTAVSTILEQLVLSTESIEKGLLNVIPSKYDDVYLPRMDHDVNPLIARVPEPVKSTGETDWTYDERLIVPADVMAFGRFLPSQFQAVWEQFWPQGAMVQQTMNAEVLRALLSTLQKRTNNQLDRLIWQGDTAGAAGIDLFDGYLKTLANDVTVIDVTNAGVITASNVIGILTDVVNAIPDAVFAQSNAVKVVCNHKTARFYDEAQAAQDFKGIDVTQGGVRTIMGIPLVAVGGIGDNNIVAGSFSTGDDSNFYGATWMGSDTSNILVDRYRPESDYWFAKITFRFGVNYGWGNEAVLYQGS
jgi:hypothetical protein